MKGVDPTGLDPLNDPAFLDSLRAYLNRPVTLNKLDEISALIVQRYRDTNHPLVDVVVPDQDVTLGTIQLATVRTRNFKLAISLAIATVLLGLLFLVAPRSGVSIFQIGSSSTALKVADIPRLFTTETFCKMVIRQQRAIAAAGSTKPA